MNALVIKIFFRSKGVVMGLLLLFGAGLISLSIGKHFLEKYTRTIQQTAQYQQESIARHVEYNADDMGLLLYYVRFGLVNELPALAGLSIGQRDINPSLQSVTIRNLQEQKYTTDLTNPLYQLLGNLDFSFVLVYLFPLIIIAFCFNLVSEEKEEGTWSLVLSQTSNPLKLLRAKLGIRYASVQVVLLLLLGIAKIYLQIPVNEAFLLFGSLALAYTTFWFALGWLVVSFHRNSSSNALVLLLSWALLTLILPAGINALTTSLYPVPEAYRTVLTSRDAYHNKWDEPKEPTIAKFHQKYPQFRQFTHPEGKDYSWLWYYAMQHMGDEESVADAQAFADKLRQRNAFSRTAGLLLPSIHTQLTLNAISLSDMENQLRFHEHLAAFHEQKRLHFYPRIFTQASVASQNWQSFGISYFADKTIHNWLIGLVPTLVLIGLCILGAGANFKRFSYTNSL